MPQGPTISIALPVFNSAPYLTAAIKSILNQTFRDFELLVVNDGSTDESAKIIDAIAAKDSRIRVWHRSNGGLVSALNFMIDEARGKLVARMDADDVCYPDRFEKQVAWLKNNPLCSVVGSSYSLIDSRSRVIGDVILPESHQEIVDLLVHGHCSMAHPSVIFVRDHVLAVGKYSSDYPAAQDLEL